MNLPFIKYVASLLLLGGTGTIAAFISLSSSEIVFWRVTLGSLFLLLVCFFTKSPWPRRLPRRTWAMLGLAGFSLAGNWLTLFAAYPEIGVGLGIVLDYTGPAIVLLAAPFLFHEALTWQRCVALVAAMAGVICISSQALTMGVTAWGLGNAIVAAVFFAGMIITNRYLYAVPSLWAATLQFCIAAVLICGYLAVTGRVSLGIGPATIWPVLLLGLNTGLCYYLYIPSVQVLPVQTVAVCGYLEPLSSVFYSLVILGQLLGPLQWAGAVLILGGAVWCEWQSRRRAAPVRERADAAAYVHQGMK